MKTKFKDIDPQELLKAVFPYTKEQTFLGALYYNKGIADWKTHFIFYQDYFPDNQYLLIVCKHSGFCIERKITGNLEELIKEIEQSENLFKFNEYPKNTGENNHLELMENVRLNEYLKSKGIKLFEPTE